ncbi:uncharacterized protein METZ01_LOCUS214034 [marine metagenome]|uniref:Uncharacterized protein n=1 Tax=marine metagenome TaxID=408172 RepID=A0A382FE33_9ZZZZ
MTKPIYDIMLCADGSTRAVEVINGVKVDPSLEDVKKQEALDKKNDEKKTRPKISIQDRIQNQVEDFISVVEGQADDFVDSGYKMKYDAYGDLVNRGCKSVHARKMKPFYIDCYNELVDVYNKDDEYVLEAWSHLKPKYHKKMMDFYGIIVDDIDRIIKNATAQRKPRKRKTYSAERLVKNLKYQQEFSELKLVSINPEKIIGAVELWVFNTRYNRLGVYRAVNSVRGFSVKGCTIQHFDENESVQKTARKPKEALNVLNKRSLKAMLKNMKTKEQPLTGRINAQTILLGVF